MKQIIYTTGLWKLLLECKCNKREMLLFSSGVFSTMFVISSDPRWTLVQNNMLLHILMTSLCKKVSYTWLLCCIACGDKWSLLFFWYFLEKKVIHTHTHTNIVYNFPPHWQLLGTAVAQWLRCCATNQKVAGSIPDGAIGIFHWHNPSDCTMALGSTHPLTERSTRRISWV